MISNCLEARAFSRMAGEFNIALPDARPWQAHWWLAVD